MLAVLKFGEFMKRVLLSIVVFWFTAASLLAQDRADLLARMRAMEERIRALEAEIKILERKPKPAGAAVIPPRKGNKSDGAFTSGEIISVTENGFVMNTQMGILKVTFSGDTKFECAAETAQEFLRKGEQVRVLGTKYPSGNVVAREILIGGPKQPKP